MYAAVHSAEEFDLANAYIVIILLNSTASHLIFKCLVLRAGSIGHYNRRFLWFLKNSAC